MLESAVPNRVFFVYILRIFNVYRQATQNRFEELDGRGGGRGEALVHFSRLPSKEENSPEEKEKRR